MNRLRLLVMFGVMLVALAPGCNRSSQPSVESSSAQTAAKRYHVKGNVVSIDKRAKMANIDAEAIPGFMDAMTMPYSVKPESELDKLQPGDLVTGDLVVLDDNSWVENIAVTSHTANK